MDRSSPPDLQSEEEYHAALKAVRAYFDNEPEADTPDAAQFESLVWLIEHYEERHYHIPRVASPRGGQGARKVEDLDEETLRAIAASEVPPEFDHLNEMIKDWKP